MGWNGILLRLNLKEFLSEETLENYRNSIGAFKPELNFWHPKRDFESYVKLVKKIKKQKSVNSQSDWDNLLHRGADWVSYKKMFQPGWFTPDSLCCMYISRGHTTPQYFHSTVPFLLEKVSKKASEIWKKLFHYGEGREPKKFVIDGTYYRLDTGKQPQEAAYLSFIVEDEIRVLQDALFKVVENKTKFKEHVEEYISNDPDLMYWKESDNEHSQKEYREWSVGFLDEFTKEMYLELIYLMLSFSKDGDIMVFGNIH